MWNDFRTDSIAQVKQCIDNEGESQEMAKGEKMLFVAKKVRFLSLRRSSKLPFY